MFTVIYIIMQSASCMHMLDSAQQVIAQAAMLQPLTHLFTIKSSHHQGVGPHFLIQPEEDCQTKSQSGHAAIALIDGLWQAAVAFSSAYQVDHNAHRCK